MYFHFMFETENENEEALLDENWINEFEETDKHYQNYYSENVSYINNYYIYVNKLNEIENIKHEKYFIKTPNVVSREEIIEILKNTIQKKYSILHILKYNINLDPSEINTFLSNPEKYNFITSLKRIDSVYFDKTIYMFQDLNDLMFIFYENDSNEKKTRRQNNMTKRVTMKPTSSFQKKTIKKRFTIHQQGTIHK